MEVSSNFECGNGKNIREIGQNQYVLETNGSDPHYSFYFHFKLKGDSQRKDVTVTVLPDPEFAQADPDLFGDDRPTTLWVRRDEFGWTRLTHHWALVENDSFQVEKSRYRIQLRVEPNAEVEISNMLPLPYSEMCGWLKTLAETNPQWFSEVEIGRSEQGRAMMGLLLHDKEHTHRRRKKKTILVFGGEHATEFAGPWSVKGLIEFLASTLPEARDLRERYEIMLAPQVNPDGNVNGTLHNIHRTNLHLDYGPKAAECRPTSREARALWEYACEFKPEICLCLHCFNGPLFGSDPPYEGAYVPSLEVFPDSNSRKKQQAANDHLCWHTDIARFWHWKELLGRTDEVTLVTRLASRNGAVGVVFEPNMSNGVIACARSTVKAFRALISGLENG